MPHLLSFEKTGDVYKRAESLDAAWLRPKRWERSKSRVGLVGVIARRFVSKTAGQALWPTARG